MNITRTDKVATREIITTVCKHIDQNQQAAALSWGQLRENISTAAYDLAQTIHSLDPADFGIKRSPIEPAEPDNLVAVANQSYQTRDGEFPIPPRLVNKNTYRDFHRMKHCMKKDIGRSVVIQSGYRSPAYQLFVFLFQLQTNQWSIPKTLESVALPGYSEHTGDPHALDLRAATFLGTEDQYEFERTAEYRWLRKNADEFGFSMSYPKENGSGTSFEPWHWKHTKG